MHGGKEIAVPNTHIISEIVPNLVVQILSFHHTQPMRAHTTTNIHHADNLTRSNLVLRRECTRLNEPLGVGAWTLDIRLALNEGALHCLIQYSARPEKQLKETNPLGLSDFGPDHTDLNANP